MRLGRNKNKRQQPNPGRLNAPRQRPSDQIGRDRLTGSYSYHNSRSSNRVNVGRVETTRPTSGHRRLRWLWRHSLIIISSLVIIFCVISELAVRPNVEVALLGNNSRTNLVTGGETAQYTKLANSLIDSSLANKNKLTIDTTSIDAAMKKHFPEIDSISVVLPFLGNRPKVYIQVYRPAFVLESRDGTFVVNKSGKAMATTTTQSAKALNVPTVTDDSNLVAEIGTQVLSSDDGSFIDYINTELATANFKVSKIVLSASRELDISFTGKRYFAKFNLERGDPRQQVGAFIAVAHQLQRQGKAPSQYIDVRLDGRAYYK